MKKGYIGKIIIGVGIALIVVPLLTSIIYDFALFFGKGSLRTNMFQNLFGKDSDIPKVISKWLSSIITNTYESSIKIFFRHIFLQNVLWLFIPNLLIVFGFCFLLKQEQNIDIKKCFNKIIIIGLAINILVLFNFFGLYNIVYRHFRMSYGSREWLSFLPRNILRTEGGMFISKFSLVLVSFLLHLILIIPTFVIFAGYMQYFQKQQITSTETVSVTGDQKSYFDGGLLQYVGWSLLGTLVTICTLGICLPWAVCMIIRWQTNHTVIKGRRLRFNGKALSFFGHCLLWTFLTVITLGIFSFWFFIAVRKWITKNTTFADSNGESKESYFDGGLLQYIGWSLLGTLVTICTFGICLPWAVCMIIRWQTEHTVIQGKRLKFNGRAMSLLGNWLLWTLLTAVTVGIFGFWFFIAVRKWITKNTVFDTYSGSEYIAQAQNQDYLPITPVSGDTWDCKKCGEKNPANSSSCKGCGEFK
jgi:uncharacterized membrane protein YjgN (DUF898 family)